MRVVVVSTNTIRSEFTTKREKTSGLEFIESLTNLDGSPDCLFYLHNEGLFPEDIRILERIGCTVFINAVIATLPSFPSDFVRVNGWPGFLGRTIIEIASRVGNLPAVGKIFEYLGWRFKLAPDVPGMVSGRIISTIINEAYFALGDNLSSKQEIDVAMRLGTNYPFGPFEWTDQIGVDNVLGLLNKLSESDKRYTPAPLLQSFNFK